MSNKNDISINYPPLLILQPLLLILLTQAICLSYNPVITHYHMTTQIPIYPEQSHSKNILSAQLISLKTVHNFYHQHNYLSTCNDDQSFMYIDYISYNDNFSKKHYSYKLCIFLLIKVVAY
jgi:hypothetical protein